MVSRAVSAVEGLEARQVMSSSLNTVVDAAGDLTVENVVLPQQSLYTGQSLSKASQSAGGAIARAFLTAHAADFGLLAGDVQSPIVTDQYKDADTGITHVYLRQSYKGLPVLNADMVVNVMPDGSVISAAGSFVPNLAGHGKKAKGPKVTAAGALVAAAGQLDLDDAGTAYSTKTAAKGLDQATTFAAPEVARGDIRTALRYVVTDAGLTLAWNLALAKPDGDHWYNVAVGGPDSAVVFASDWVDNASYNVVARPNESPQDGGFGVVTDPADPVASPYGWHDTNGVAGAEYTDTRGNNVDSHLDRVVSGTDNDVPDGTRPDGGAALNFTGTNFTQVPTAEPTTAVNQSVAQTNLFYAVNTAHDIHYRYGFTEAAGNFQTNNYGKGGLGNDAVQADAQDGGGTDNANFATPPDGTAGRMQMYLFTAPTPDRDGDLDMGVIYHEFGHGVSTRLTGGPSNSDGLNALQSGGMGEGWSDFFALMFLQRSSDTQNGKYAIGTYVLGQDQTTGAGIRRYPYSYDMSVDPLTIDAYGGSGTSAQGVARQLEVHDTGEIWTSALWDLNWNLINKYGYGEVANGFSASNVKGNQLAMQLVLDALKLQPTNPTFKDARDAILQADANLHATLGTPSNAAEIWAAFARRGMGTGLATLGSGSDQVTASYTVPVADPTVTSTLPGTTISPFGTVDIRFDQPMNTGSFAVADDVLAFTGPNNNNDLKPQITGFTWLDSTTLRLNLASTQTVRGIYTLVLAPSILAADDGHAMDTNRNGTPGEVVADIATLPINLTATVGPDNYGYKFAGYPFENINLVAGTSGVTTLTNNSDDASKAVPLGSNTFNFYGTTYTASQLFAGVNGLITFGSANTSYYNSPLDSFGPTQASIAPLWADFRTDVNGTGGGDSTLLYKLDTANNRLIIEWNDVATYYGTGAATFQAILQLNTGSTPGRIVFNYVDADVGTTDPFGGVGTTGIKGAGAPTANRLLLNNDGPNPWIATGKAVIAALDVTAPKVTGEAFNTTAGQSFTVTFSEDVAASLSAADFVLTNTTTNTVVNTANLALSYNAATRTATLTNTGPTLANGNYTLAIASAGVTDAAGNPLDGDADNVIGGNHAFSTFVLAGDADRNRVVDFNDFLTLQNNFNTPQRDFAKGDFNYDGVIDFNDFLILQNNYNVTV